MAIGHGKTGKIAFNEWPLSGARIASLNVGMWAFSPFPKRSISENAAEINNRPFIGDRTVQ